MSLKATHYNLSARRSVWIGCCLSVGGGRVIEWPIVDVKLLWVGWQCMRDSLQHAWWLCGDCVKRIYRWMIIRRGKTSKKEKEKVRGGKKAPAKPLCCLLRQSFAPTHKKRLAARRPGHFGSLFCTCISAGVLLEGCTAPATMASTIFSIVAYVC